jgi:hypothetical protein
MPVLPVSLSDGFVPIIQLHDPVRVGQTLATRTRLAEHIVAIAQELGVPPAKAATYLRKNPGDSLQPGEEIARKKNFWGKTEAAVVSSVEGIVTRYERDTAMLYIRRARETSGEETIISPIEGTIALCNNEKILVETDKHFVLGKRGSGDQITEVLVSIHENSSDAVQSYELDAASIGKIVLGKYFSKELLMKSVSMGVAGIVGTKFLDEDLAYLKNRQITIPVIEIEEADFPALKHWHTKRAYVHGEGKTIILLHT